ncbi:hypothetical protein RDABS01_031588 [Bienertia sinuspersici]
MKKNRQLTTTWMAKEMLLVFKVRPHWLAKEIAQTIKQAYKIIVSDDLAYKTKYKAHKLLHRLMKDHYNKSYLELGDGSGIAIISDEHQAIFNVVSTVLPQAEHRHCARHVYAHWKKKGFSGDEMKLAFWTIAKAYNMTDFTEALS